MMSEFREDDQAGNDVMQAFWNTPLGREWKQQDEEAIARLQEQTKPIAMGFLMPVDEMNIKRFESKKLEVMKLDEATEEELQASKSLGAACHDLRQVGEGFNDAELAELARIQTELEQLEEEFDTILINRYGN